MNGEQHNANRVIFDLIENALSKQIYWSDHNSENCISTDWRVLPFWVVLSIRHGEYQCIFSQPSVGSAHPSKVQAAAEGVLLIPAGIRHRLIVDQPTVADGVHIQYHIFQNLDALSFYEVPAVVNPPDSSSLFNSVVELTAALQKSNSAPTINSIALKTSLAYQLFYEILRASKPGAEQERRFLQVKRILPAIQIIESQMDGPLKVEALAKACNLSRNSFTRLFKQAIGESPLRYINQKRLDSAMAHLVHSDLSIAQIASHTGFCDQFHFSKTFNRAIGESPTQYRVKTRHSLQAAL